MSEHTPGPWKVLTIASPDGASFRIYAQPFENTAATIDIAHIPRDWDGEANARLIAAAPDLLEALIAMFSLHGKPMREEWLNPQGFENAKAVDAQARAAIAKATGEA